MLISALVGLASIVVGSFVFCFWLEEDQPAIFTKTVYGRVVAVILEQPGVLGTIAVHAVALPIGLVAHMLSERHSDSPTALATFWADVKGTIKDIGDYYLKWVPTFVASGKML